MTEGSVLFKWLVLLAIVGLVCLAGLLALVRREMHVAQGDEIVWEEVFGFSVLEHRTEKRIGDVEPKGVFHVVRLEVRNHAEHVSYPLDNHRVFLRDEDGVVYPVDAAAERVLDPTWPQRSAIAQGTTFSSELAFDVPQEKKSLRLGISWGGPLIDMVMGPKDIALR
jgi:hypothetical protein